MIRTIFPRLLEVTGKMPIKVELDDGRKIDSTLGELSRDELLSYANQMLREKKFRFHQELMKYLKAKFGNEVTRDGFKNA